MLRIQYMSAITSPTPPMIGRMTKGGLSMTSSPLNLESIRAEVVRVERHGETARGQRRKRSSGGDVNRERSPRFDGGGRRLMLGWSVHLDTSAA